MEFEKILLVLIIFLVGFLSANLFNVFVYYGSEFPLVNGLGFLEGGFVEAPSDFIELGQIKVYDDRVVIYVDDASLSRYAPTGSMVPVLDEGSNGIRVPVYGSDDIEIGDIVSFDKDGVLIVHRVIEKGTDSEGVYFITKGDNNNMSDGKVRFEDIEYKTVGVIW